jgi:hypothetical protein
MSRFSWNRGPRAKKGHLKTRKMSRLRVFWPLRRAPYLGASQHPDKGVCQFGYLILAMSQSSDALLDHIADYL